MTADAGGQPVDGYQTEEAIYALSIGDIMGGRICG